MYTLPTFISGFAVGGLRFWKSTSTTSRVSGYVSSASGGVPPSVSPEAMSGSSRPERPSAEVGVVPSHTRVSSPASGAACPASTTSESPPSSAGASASAALTARQLRTAIARSARLTS